MTTQYQTLSSQKFNIKKQPLFIFFFPSCFQNFSGSFAKDNQEINHTSTYIYVLKKMLKISIIINRKTKIKRTNIDQRNHKAEVEVKKDQ